MEKRTVLFVDDDEAILKELEIGLRDEPYDRHFVASGEKAIEFLKRQEAHVIVVDMVMPRMDGLELLRIIKKEHPDIVSVVLTGYAQNTDIKAVMLELGIHNYVPKPWLFDEDFKTVIRVAVDHYNFQSEHKDTTQESETCSNAERYAEEVPA